MLTMFQEPWSISDAGKLRPSMDSSLQEIRFCSYYRGQEFLNLALFQAFPLCRTLCQVICLRTTCGSSYGGGPCLLLFFTIYYLLPNSSNYHSTPSLSNPVLNILSVNQESSLPLLGFSHTPFRLITESSRYFFSSLDLNLGIFLPFSLEDFTVSTGSLGSY